jgi:hypothetical protein
MAVMNVSIIIVSRNVRELLAANLDRLFSLATGLSYEIFVVDNASHDGTARMVRERFPRATLISNDWNAGFAKANNQALRLAQGEVCILLNPDMLVEPGALETAHRELTRDKTIGVLGLKLVGQDGKPVNSVRRYPDIWSQLAVLLALGRLFPKMLDRYHRTDFDYGVSQDVDQVRGSFFAFRRELLETVGYLDEGFHVWFEEVDYCRRVRANGLRIRYCAEASAKDFVGKSAGQMRRYDAQKIFSASMIRYFSKYHPRWQANLLRLTRPISLVGHAGVDVWNDFRKKI